MQAHFRTYIAVCWFCFSIPCELNVRVLCIETCFACMICSLACMRFPGRKCFGHWFYVTCNFLPGIHCMKQVCYVCCSGLLFWMMHSLIVSKSNLVQEYWSFSDLRPCEFWSGQNMQSAIQAIAGKQVGLHSSHCVSQALCIHLDSLHSGHCVSQAPSAFMFFSCCALMGINHCILCADTGMPL